MTTTAIRKAPVTEAGALPSPKIEALHSVGESSNVRMSVLVLGDVVLLRGIALTIVRMDYNGRRAGARLILRELESDTVRSLQYDPDSWITRFRLSSSSTDRPIRIGDIVLYPGLTPGRSVAAIRQGRGWFRTCAPWMPQTDMEVALHLAEGRAEIVRSVGHTIGRRRRPLYPSGTLVACRDSRMREPTVWLRTDEDYWTSNSRGATASDDMINFELERRTYHVPYIPGEN